MKKTCVTCKWVALDDLGIDFAQCSNPKTMKKNVMAVSGTEDKEAMYYCSTVRLFWGLTAWMTRNCGINGRFWEPKEQK